jgi:hypothetical protein
VSADAYRLCLYDGTGLVLSASAPPDGVCPRNKPCWTQRQRGFNYNDRHLTPDGLLAVVLHGGRKDGQTRLVVKAKGPRLDLPEPAALASPLTVQLHGGGQCWEATYSAPFQKQRPGLFMDKAD